MERLFSDGALEGRVGACLQIVARPGGGGDGFSGLTDPIRHADVAIVTAACWAGTVARNIGAADIQDGVVEGTVAGGHCALALILQGRSKRRATAQKNHV